MSRVSMTQHFYEFGTGPMHDKFFKSIAKMLYVSYSGSGLNFN